MQCVYHEMENRQETLKAVVRIALLKCEGTYGHSCKREKPLPVRHSCTGRRVVASDLAGLHHLLDTGVLRSPDRRYEGNNASLSLKPAPPSFVRPIFALYHIWAAFHLRALHRSIHPYETGKHTGRGIR